ncbi:MAG: aminopeptidase P family protein [Peptostreptococcaceae bacterium]|uniref:aminopeptidase P family protein n=1 Tax=Romboutsia timonensis TaxID=1776391 RepID=UPI001D60D77F|nr:aminopeptidase P family protein [Romboutsia timonensis]MBS5025878.1 aminopeptidase P family protein [Peptostreptococcaceae bacterium]
MMIKQRIENIRDLMKEKNIYAYIVPSSDYHQSEYVGDYFKSREFMSGFTGSSGTLIISMDEAGLWTDGRYFIQAEQELKDSGIKLFKMGEEGVPTIEEYLLEKLPKNSTLGFDGRVMSVKEGQSLANKLAFKGINIEYKYDLVNDIWEDRCSLPTEKAFLLGTEYSGESFSDKLSRIRAVMKEKKATTHILASLDDIAWLFNIRGRDVKSNPVVLSYAVITIDSVYLFIDKNKIGKDIRAELSKENVQIKGYEEVYEFIKNIDENEVVLIDTSKVNYAIYNNIPSNVQKIEERNPSILFKSIKNEIELKNIRNSHIKDGVAFTKFMYWLKNNIGKIEITEISATQKLEEFRREQDKFIEPSFSTIAAYKDHAAMMHYSATEESNYKLEPRDLFLVDSGGQYFDGTTDITRTIALGPIPENVRKDFTNVVRGMIRLSKAKFLYGCRGYNLDILARGPLWEEGIDYKCGTGHGIGFVLNVHEGPNGFRWKVREDIDDSCILEEGMVTTNEPGVYVENSHGIRIENEIVVRKAEKNEYGQFMDFEVITFAPIDLDAIDESLILKDEKVYLNNYHKQVYDKISPYLNEEEKQWLKTYTREI